MKISLIAAASANSVIGVDGTLPWHLPDDFRFFKATTLGKPVVMGRRTWETLGKALPGRQNIVITRSPGYDAPGADVVSSPGLAIEAAADTAELMVIGGGEIYRQFLPLADRVYLTRVECEIDGDTVFPDLDPAEWQLCSSEAHDADERHRFPFEFRIYDRIRPGG